MSRVRMTFAVGLVVASAALGRGQPQLATPAPIPVTDVLLPYLGDKLVQKDLKLDEGQVKKLLALRQRVWDERHARTPLTDAAAEFKEALSADQFQRAEQLAVQFLWSDSGADARRAPTSILGLYPAVADALKLDDTQKRLVSEGRKGTTPGGAGSGPRFVYLSPEQTALAKALRGPALAGAVQPEYDARTPARTGLVPFVAPEPLVLTATTTRDVQKELRLSEEQLDALTELRAKWQRAFRDAGQKASPELTADTKDAIGKILTPDQLARAAQIERQRAGADAEFVAGSAPGKELGVTDDQRKRFAAANAAHHAAAIKVVLAGLPVEKARYRELNLQLLESARMSGGDTAAAYPGVADAIELTDEQKRLLLGGEGSASVLTGEQKKAVAAMLGKPGKLDDLFPGLTPIRTSAPAVALSEAHAALLDTALWDALKLDREQAARVAAAANQFAVAALPVRFTPGAVVTREQLLAEQTAAYAAVAKALDAALTADQRKRLDQLAVQQEIARGLDSFLLGGTAFDLTPDQRAKVIALRNGAKESALLLGAVGVASGQERAALAQQRDRLDADLMSVLTADQKAKLTALTGEPHGGFAKKPLPARRASGGNPWSK